MKIGLVTLHSFGLILLPDGRGMKIGLVTLHSFGLILLPKSEWDRRRILTGREGCSLMALIWRCLCDPIA